MKRRGPAVGDSVRFAHPVVPEEHPVHKEASRAGGKVDKQSGKDGGVVRT